jgi:hypothetical protein
MSVDYCCTTSCYKLVVVVVLLLLLLLTILVHRMVESIAAFHKHVHCGLRCRPHAALRQCSCFAKHKHGSTPCQSNVSLHNHFRLMLTRHLSVPLRGRGAYVVCLLGLTPCHSAVGNERAATLGAMDAHPCPHVQIFADINVCRKGYTACDVCCARNTLCTPAKEALAQHYSGYLKLAAIK